MRDNHNILDSDTKFARDILVKHEKRVRRMKWATIIGWLLVAFLYVVLAVIERTVTNSGDSVSAWFSSGIVVLQALFIYAVFLSIRLYIYHRNLNMNKIQMRLASIEDALRRMESKEK